MFAKVVRARRQRLGLTQDELAAKAGLGVRTIRQIEAGTVGTPRPATVRLLAEAFGLVGADREAFCQAAVGQPIDQPITPDVTAQPTAHVPVQLTADVLAFTGREEQLARLDALVATAGDQPNAVVISALSGTAGVGKTALAVHWAHRVRNRFPDGQLYVNLRGYDPDRPVDPGDALTGFLSALGVTGQGVPQNLDERAARYRSELADRRMLVVLDNAGSVEQVRPLLPGSSSSMVVVTSRDSLAGLVAVHGAHRIELDLLTPDEAVALLHRLIGTRAQADPEAAATLADQCARLPLALRVAGELAISRPTSTLPHLVAELGDQRRRLDLLDGGDPYTAVRTVFSWSIQHLPPDATATFRMLALHPGHDIDPYAAAGLGGTSLEEAHHRLEVLSRAHLLHFTGPGRYGMHDLLRAFAAELTHTHDTDQVRSAAQGRLLDHYRHAASVAMDAAYPYERERRPRIPTANIPTPDLSDPNQATEWLDLEHPNLLTAARHAADHGWPKHTLDLSAILHRHLRTRGLYGDAETLHHRALELARTIGDRAGEMNALTYLGDVHWLRGRYEQARDRYGQALEIARNTGDRAGQLSPLIGLGHIHLQQGRYEQARDRYGQALEIAHSTGHRADGLAGLIGLGWVHGEQGRYEQALDHYEQALEIAQTAGDRAGELNVLFGLGWVHLLLGRYEPARDHYEQALEIANSTGNRTSKPLIGLGHVHRLQGRYEPARDHYEQALEIARRTGNHTSTLSALIGLGHVHRLQGRFEQAADLYQQVLDRARKVRSGNWEFEAVQGLGRLHHTTGHQDLALVHHRHALELATALAQPADQARAHDGLAHAHNALDRSDQARQYWQQALNILTGLGTCHTEDQESNTSTIRAHLAALADR